MQKGPLVAAFMLTLSKAQGADFTNGVAAYIEGGYQIFLVEFCKLTERGNATAEYNLGVMYSAGDDVLQSYTEVMN